MALILPFVRALTILLALGSASAFAAERTINVKIPHVTRLEIGGVPERVEREQDYQMTLRMQVDENGEILVPSSIDEAAKYMRSAMPREAFRQLVWLYGYNPKARIMKSSERPLSWLTDVRSYLLSAWNIDRGEMSSPLACAVFGEGSMMVFEILAVEEEVREFQLSPRKDVPRDFSSRSPYMLAERIRGMCSHYSPAQQAH